MNFIKILCWLAGLLFLCGCAPQRDLEGHAETTDNPDKPGLVLEEFIYMEAPFPSCHAATVLELENGELLVAFFGGSREADPDVEIWLSRKPPGGSWSAPVSVADGVQSENERLATGNPILFQPAGGDVFLFYKVFRHNSPWWGEFKRSADHGKSWSMAIRIPAGLIGPDKNKPLDLGGGVILAPSAIEDENGWRVYVERSTDNGNTWSRNGPIHPGAQIEAIQPTFLKHPDGRIQMLCRTQSRFGFMAQSWSEDKGLNWSPLELASLPNNNAGFDGITLQDGRHLLVYNHSTREQEGMGHKGRGVLNVALSNNGVDWEAALILDYVDAPQKQFSYPAVIQARDGLVHIVYTWHRERIKHVVLDPEKLRTLPIVKGEWPEEIRP